MKKSIFSLAIFAILFVSCQTEKQDVIEDGMPAPEIIASVETNSATRTLISVDEEGEGRIYWTPADQINIFYGTASTLYTSQNTQNATTAVFRTTDIIGSTESASTNIWGLYPYDEDAECSGTAVTTTLPATQFGVPGTFDDDLYITLAHSTSNALKFFNVCGGIKFSLSRADITSVTFKGNNNEDIAGDISLTFENDLPKATVVNGLKEITLTPKTGATFAQDVNYYLIVLPGTLSGGFTMTFTTSNGAIGTFNYNANSITIKRSIFSKKAEIDSYATFEVNPQTKNSVIYYTSSNNRIITPYATNAFGSTIVSNEYENGLGVITFDGDVTQIGYQAFRYCSKLTGITIPESVTSIGYQSFDHCSSLTSISLPESVTSIGNDSFYCCSNLTSVTFHGSVTSIGDFAFGGTGLESITIPNSVTSIGIYAFACTRLTAITIPENVISLGVFAFDGCEDLRKIVFLRTTPILIDDRMFEDEAIEHCRLFVPAASVNSYKSSGGWQRYSERIYALPEYIDLGLSVKWASFNIGACNPEDYGDYFAWGETETYYSKKSPIVWKEGKSAGYAWASYQFNPSGDGITFTKYTGSDYDTLLSEDDAATMIWGDNWRMPTYEEWAALQNEEYFTWEWTTDYLGTGVAGRIVTSKIPGYSGNSIFLPAAGVRASTSLSFSERQGWYWTSTHKGDYPYHSNFYAWGSYFSSGMIDDNISDRYDGQTIRPVYVK